MVGWMDRWIDSISSVPSTTVSTLSCVELSGDVSGAVNITVKWTLSNESVDFYLINITTNAPQTPYGGTSEHHHCQCHTTT